MNQPLNALMEKAARAEPPAILARSSWLAYVPVIQVLMTQRAFNLKAAVKWLVQQGEIAPAKEGCAYRALLQILTRRQKKAARLGGKEARPA